MSTSSAGGLSSIGNMLAAPYSEQPRVVEQRNHHITAQATSDRVHSYSGDIEQDSAYSDDESAVLAFDRPALNNQSSQRAAPSNQARPPTVVHFPEPTLISPVHANEPIRPARREPPRRPNIQIPNSPHTPSQSPGGQFSIPSLPSSGTPISPHLALPPLQSPRAPFANHSNSSRGSVSSVSSSSESIRAFDLMKEKKALFREGEEELMSPFRERKEGGRQESGPRPHPRRGNRPVTDYFWKRFSVSVRLDERGQER